MDCFSQHNLPKLSKITVNCPKGTNRVNSDLPKVSKTISHRETRNIKFRQQVNIIERVPSGTPPQAVVMTLAHNHVTDLFISSCRGATVIKFGQ